VIGALKILRQHVSSEILEQMGCTGNRGFRQLAWSVIAHSMSQDDASWWIKTREEDPAKWIEDTGVRCIREWTKTKPFK
jgi:hypothetical protein